MFSSEGANGSQPTGTSYPYKCQDEDEVVGSRSIGVCYVGYVTRQAILGIASTVKRTRTCNKQENALMIIILTYSRSEHSNDLFHIHMQDFKPTLNPNKQWHKLKFTKHIAKDSLAKNVISDNKL